MKEFTEKIIVSAVDQDGLNVNAYVFEFITKKGIDIAEAIRNASRDYCKTEDGLTVYIGTHIGCRFCILAVFMIRAAVRTIRRDSSRS